MVEYEGMEGKIGREEKSVRKKRSSYENVEKMLKRKRGEGGGERDI